MKLSDAETMYKQAAAVAEYDICEGADAEADEIMLAVLKAIAAGECEDPTGCAQIAVKAWDLPTMRLYS